MDQQQLATITPQYLSTLDKIQLVDLLQNRTRLLLAASTVRLPSQEDIKTLTEEVKAIQEAIRSRD